jgi:hypothetical protein
MEVVGMPEFRAATQIRLLSEPNAAGVKQFAKTSRPEGARPNSHAVDKKWSLIGGRLLSLSPVPGSALKPGDGAKKIRARHSEDQTGSSSAGTTGHIRRC